MNELVQPPAIDYEREHDRLLWRLHYVERRLRRQEEGCRVCRRLRARTTSQSAIRLDVGEMQDGGETQSSVWVCGDCLDDILRAMWDKVAESPYNDVPAASRDVLPDTFRDLIVAYWSLLTRSWSRSSSRDAPKDLYFARSLLGGDLIKIGVSAQVDTRMRDLKAQALLVMKGEARREAELHARFADDRITGEWFRPSDALMAFIEENRV